MPLAPIAAPRQRTDFPLAGSYMRAARPATALTDGAHHRLALVHKLAANVDVAGARAHAHACSIRSGGPGAVHLSGAGSSCLAWRCMSSSTSSICHCEGQLERACTPRDAMWRAKFQLVQWHDSHARPPERHATPDGWPLAAPTRSLQQRCIIPTVDQHSQLLRCRPRHTPRPLTRDEAALHELVRLVAHDLAVLACARLRLVAVHHKVRGAAVRHLHLHSREAGVHCQERWAGQKENREGAGGQADSPLD